MRKEWVMASRVDGMMGRIEQLNKRAERLGCAPLTAAATGCSLDKESTDELGFVRSVTYLEFSIEGGLPQMEGNWTLRAVIEHQRSGNIVHVVRGDSEAAWWKLPSRCDHCSLNRRRKTTMIVEDADGDARQVGSSCAKDFLGMHGDPVAWAKWYTESMEAVNRLPSAESNREEHHATRYVVAMADCILDKLPFEPTSLRLSTRDLVSEWLSGFGGSDGHEAKKRLRAAGVEPPSDIDAPLHDLRNWVNRCGEGGDFLRNLRSAAAKDHVESRHIGLVVAGVHIMRKESAEKAARELMPKTDMQTGKGIEVTGMVVSVKWRPDGFGGETMKCLLDCGSLRLWGTVPAAITMHEDGRTPLCPGDVVSFVANVSKSERDKDFGFYSRPRKAEIVSVGAHAVDEQRSRRLANGL